MRLGLNTVDKFRLKRKQRIMGNKRILICGPAASGKTFLREKLEQKGFKFDISYTTRPPRPSEVDGVDYNFISEDEFTLRIANGAFYEHVSYNGYRYGTGLYEWNNMSYFIMETDGIKHITPEDRKNCFIIYMNPPALIRQQRLLNIRKWSEEDIHKRMKTDHIKFNNFTDYDLEITNSNIIL